MKKETLKSMKPAFLFCLVFIILFIFLNWVYIILVWPNTQLEKTDKQFWDNLNSTKILFLGASHTKCAINPSFINNSFNFASNGANYMLTYYKLKTILAINESKSEIIVLPIDLNSFSSYYSNRIDSTRYWKKYINFKELSNMNNNISFINLEINNLFPIIGAGHELITLALLKKTELIKGHSISFKDLSLEKDKKRAAINDAKLHFKNNKILDKIAMAYFKKILELAKKKKLKVILIKYPITKEYFIAAQEWIPNIEEHYQRIFNETQEYNNILILDYQNIFFENYSLFKDNEHLNEFGAQILSKKMGNDLNKIKLTNELKLIFFQTYNTGIQEYFKQGS